MKCISLMPDTKPSVNTSIVVIQYFYVNDIADLPIFK